MSSNPLPSSLSPSQLGVYLDCSQKWDFSYVQGMKPKNSSAIYFDKGNYIHELLHHYYSLLKTGFKIGDDIIHSSMVARIKEDIEYAQKLAEESGTEVDYNFYQGASRIVMRYVEEQSPKIDKGIKDLQIEEHLEIEYDGRILHGYVDLIYYRDGQWYIRDHKSGKQNRYNRKTVYRDTQLMFYGALFYKLTGNVANVEINYLNSDPPAKISAKTKLFALEQITTHTQTVYENFFKYICDVHDRQKSLPPMRNLSSCANCNYHPICNLELRGLSSDLVRNTRYARKEADQVSEKHSFEPTVPLKINLGTVQR